jgi:hypothetical protein
MPIHRTRPTKNFTVIDNRILRDDRLKGEETGLLVRLLSRPPRWKIIIAIVMREMGWGRDKTYRLLNRLIDLGYVHRDQERDNVSGSFGEVVYSVFAEPSQNPASRNLAPIDNPLPDSPLPRKPKAPKEEKKESTKIPPTPTIGKTRTSDQASQSRTGDPVLITNPSFEEFWIGYKPDRYMSRHAAERKWNRMDELDRRAALDATPVYLDDCRAIGRKRVNIVRYLDDRIWEGYMKKDATRVTLHPDSPQWIKWRAHFVATGQSTSFMDARAREGKVFTVPTEWPPGKKSQCD